jgi:site-specific DNA-methyltransferase (adenine-specific)
MQLGKKIYNLSPVNETIGQSNFINRIIYGNSLYILKNIPDKTVDLVITSPPYFQQKDYGNGGCGIGNEETETQYLDSLMEIFYETVRVTKKTGAIVFNLGDKYLNRCIGIITI